MLDRIVNGALVLIFGGVTVFASTLLGRGVDNGDAGLTIAAGLFMLAGFLSAAFFAQDLLYPPHHERRRRVGVRDHGARPRTTAPSGESRSVDFLELPETWIASDLANLRDEDEAA